MIQELHFVHQYDSGNVQECINDVESCGCEVYWTSLTQDTGIAVLAAYIPDMPAFISSFSQTQSYQYLKDGN